MTNSARGPGALVAAVAAVIALAGCSVSAPPAEPTAAPTTSPPATSSLPTDDVQAALEALVTAGAPAATIEVTAGDQTWSRAEGVVDIERNEAATPQAPVRIASITKTMVAAVVLQLVAEGDLSLDDPVENTLPGLLPEPVTVRQLLNHTSGVPNYLPVLVPSTPQGIAAGADDVYTDDQLIAAALEQPRTSAPGEKFSYANTNYVILGRVVETITGAPLAQALTTRVIEPLGLKATTYPQGPAMPPGHLAGYLLDGKELVDVTAYEPSIWSASGAVISTVGDLNRFFRALFDGTLLPSEQVAALQEVSASGYGLGVLAGGDACDPASGDLVYGQRGNGFGYRSFSFSSPDGKRQVTLAWTASAANPAQDPLEQPANAALVAALAATCP